MTPPWGSLLWFLAVVAAIPAVLCLLKRTPLGGGASGGALRNVAVLPLSASQRVAIVEVGSGEARRWLVLGVTAQSINTLHTMEPQAAALPSEAETSATFSQLLSRLRPDK